MIVIMDVDGTVIDTREQVREAYARAGVIQPPETFHLPWEEWLPDAAGGMFAATRVHKRKNQIYHKVLREMPPKILPAGRMLKEYRGAGLDMYLTTSGSEEGVMCALAETGLGFATVLGFELTKEQKNDIFSKFVRPGVYVDDNKKFKVTAPGWRFVHYDGQPYHRLIESIWKATPREQEA